MLMAVASITVIQLYAFQNYYMAATATTTATATSQSRIISMKKGMNEPFELIDRAILTVTCNFSLLTKARLLASSFV